MKKGVSNIGGLHKIGVVRTPLPTMLLWRGHLAQNIFSFVKMKNHFELVLSLLNIKGKGITFLSLLISSIFSVVFCVYLLQREHVHTQFSSLKRGCANVKKNTKSLKLAYVVPKINVTNAETTLTIYVKPVVRITG